jgi:hypothetical protein
VNGTFIRAEWPVVAKVSAWINFSPMGNFLTLYALGNTSALLVALIGCEPDVVGEGSVDHLTRKTAKW